MSTASRRRHRIRSIAWALTAILVVGTAIVVLVRIPPEAFSQLLTYLIEGRDNTPLTPEQLAYEALFDGMDPPETSAVRPFDGISLNEAFAQFAFTERYSQRYTVRYTDGDRTLLRTADLSRDGASYTLSLYEGESLDPKQLVHTVTCDGERITVVDVNGNTQTHLVGADFPLSSVAHQPEPTTLAEALVAYERDPSASPYSAMSATVADSAEGRILTLTFTERETGITGAYTYLLDHAMLYAATANRAGEPYYDLKTTAYLIGGDFPEEE